MDRTQIAYLEVIKQQFNHFKERAEEAIEQLTEPQWHWKPNEESNSIAVIIQHLHGNMNSRWVDFFKSDGEKETRKRDIEFIDQHLTKESLMERWNQGWDLLFNVINNLMEEDLMKTITIRNQSCSVLHAIQIEIAHISYHLGQMIYIGKQIKNHDWKILSIPKGESDESDMKEGESVEVLYRRVKNRDRDQLSMLAAKLATSFNLNSVDFANVFDSIINDKKIDLIVAEKEQELIGYVLVLHHPAFYANGVISWVEELFVLEQYRGNGLGRSIMSEVERLSKERGSKLVALATRRADKFYKSIGYDESATYFKKTF
jgi:predicted acetyltransferase